MASPFLNFYAGNMAPPIRGPGNTLQAVPNYLTPEQIYAGMGLAPPNLPLNPPMPPRPSNSWPGGSDAVGAGPGSFAQMRGFASDPIYGGGGGDVQTAAAGPQPAGTIADDKDPARLMSDPLSAYGGAPGLGEPGTSAGIDAITTATRQFLPGMLGRGLTGIGGMQWENVPEVPAAPAGDPWSGLRLGETAPPSVPGTATGNRSRDMPRPPSPPQSVVNPRSRELMDMVRNLAAATDPKRGQKIETANNGTQTVGTKLNNSSRGRTVTGDNWFNSVRGL